MPRVWQPRALKFDITSRSRKISGVKKNKHEALYPNSAEVVRAESSLTESRSFVTAIRERASAPGEVRLNTVSLSREAEGIHKDQSRGVNQVTPAGLENSFPYREFHKGSVKGNRKMVGLACELSPDKQKKTGTQAKGPRQTNR